MQGAGAAGVMTGSLIARPGSCGRIPLVPDEMMRLNCELLPLITP